MTSANARRGAALPVLGAAEPAHAAAGGGGAAAASASAGFHGAPTGAAHVDVAADAVRDAGAARIGFVTLGCDKNTVDSERYAASLAGAGARLDAVADADVVVINTCGFIDAAKEESIETILDAVRLKREGRVRAVVAVGCLVQRYKRELEREIPEVDLFLGLTDASRLVPELRARGLLPQQQPANMARPLRLLSTGATRHSAFLKISEGCDHGCAFCAIPLMRGKHRSMPIERLVAEAQELEARGAVELCLVSQDTTWYGRDLQRGIAPAEEFYIGRTFAGMAGDADGGAGASGAPRRERGPSSRRSTGLLPDLLRALLDGTDVPWFRLFYMYPSGIRPELVELIASEPRILPYLDMPIQHGSDTMLARMRRPERRGTILERVAWLRSAVPELTLRTTVIVGFPGETDREYEDLLGLLEEVRFDRVGAFPYSVEEGTAAASMPGAVGQSLKRERLERLLDLQRAIGLDRQEAWIGRETATLVEARVGRASGMDDPLDVGTGVDRSGGAVAPAHAAREPGSADDDAPRGAVGRTKAQAPEVDGVVHIDDARGARVGEMIRVRITGALEDDLIGECV